VKRFVAIVAFLVFPNICFAEADKDYSYIKHLYQEKDYYRCISEAKRFLFYNVSDIRVSDVELLIAHSYYYGGDQKEAFIYYTSVAQKYKDTDNSNTSMYRVGVIQYENGLFCDSYTTFKKLVDTNSVSEDLAQKARTYIDMIVLEEKGSNCTFVDKDKYTSKHYTEREDEYLALEKKSPRTAGTLSALVPGLGQLYVGRPRDAFVAFLLNGLFIWGIVEAVEADNWGAATALGAVELGWYSGNIYSAVSGAHKYNEKKRNHLFNKYKIDYQLNLVSNDDKKIVFSLNYNF